MEEPNTYFRLEGKTPVAITFEDRQKNPGSWVRNRRVGRSDFKVYKFRKPRKGGYKKPAKRISVMVSTVFLGFNHGWDPSEPPILFETMIFFMSRSAHKDPLEQACTRYSTWDEAEAGHKNICELLKNRR